MSKKAKLSEEQVDVGSADQAVSVADLSPTPQPAATAKISDADVIVLERARMALKLVAKEAERALAESKSAEMTYKYIVLQLYMKYGLTDTDGLDEAGNIHRNVSRG